MAPAIALRLRQHLTLTPQVQQALKLLQMSALEFAQEMEEALSSNPFLEENADTPPAQRDAATTRVSEVMTSPVQPIRAGSTSGSVVSQSSARMLFQVCRPARLKPQRRSRSLRKAWVNGLESL